jgi:hypothetical protein
MLYDVEIHEHDGTVWAQRLNLSYEEAMAIMAEWEVDYQDEYLDVVLIPHATENEHD